MKCISECIYERVRKYLQVNVCEIHYRLWTDSTKLKRLTVGYMTFDLRMVLVAFAWEMKNKLISKPEKLYFPLSL